MQTAFLITARLKSKRLPKKILLEVQGKPIVVQDKTTGIMSYLIHGDGK